MERTVFLVDMNAFFISCETSRDHKLRDIPAAVAGDPHNRTGIILAANYKARAYGVKTAMTVNEARKLCPSIQLVPPDHDFYRLKSGQVMSLLAEYSPLLEQNSIDEAWLDMTGCERLFGKPLDSAGEIMRRISQELDLWCSIGIAPNKFLAKMASELKKPLGISELNPGNLADKFWPLPVGTMYGIGSKTAQRLHGLGIMTIGDLAGLNERYLTNIFGKNGAFFHQHANGIDNDPVMPSDRDEMKSIGRSTTLTHDIDDLEHLRMVLMELTEDICRTARRHGKKARTVRITLKYPDFSVITRQAALTSASDSCNEVFAGAYRLLESNWSDLKPIRLIGVTISGFEQDLAERQLSLFDCSLQNAAAENYNYKQSPEQHVDKRHKLDQVMDQIKDKHGDTSIKRASLLQKNTVAD